jgi:peptide/nickel transport system substrate-binding protein
MFIFRLPIPRKLHCSHAAWLMAALLVAALLAGCGGSKPTPAPAGPAVTAPVEQPTTPPTTAAAPAATAEPATPSGPQVATIAFVQEFDTLNPLYAQALSAIYAQPLWNCRAWNFDDQNSPVPVVVKEIPTRQNGGVSEDGKTITLKLRDDAAWTDGTPITADDFVFTYQMTVNPANNALITTPYDQVESITAPDAHTVVINFKAPYGAWLTTLYRYLLPAHVLKPVFDSQGSLANAEWNRAPTVGCGPFVFKSWEAGKEARFSANEKYWLGKPKLTEIVTGFLGSDDAKSAALKAGQADLATFLVNTAAYLKDLRQAGMQTLPVNSGYIEGWYFMLDPTNGQPALQDVKVRQAIAYALDRDGMRNTIKGGAPELAASLWDNTPYVDPSLKPYPYDPEKAKQLLEEAGWVDTNSDGIREKGGVDLVVSQVVLQNEDRLAVQQVVKDQLAAVGIKIDPSNVDSASFFLAYDSAGPIATGQYDIFEYAPRTNNFPDPGTYDFMCDHIPSAQNPQGENWSFLCDKELDALLQQGAKEIDFEKRQQIYQKASKLIYDKAYFLAFWTDPDFWMAGPQLKNVRLSGVTPFFNAAEWQVSR